MTLFADTRRLLAVAGIAATAAAAAVPVPAEAQASPDLLIAPTRVVLDGQRGAEVILSNTGEKATTYRISLELRRMTPDGRLEEVETEAADAREAATLGMIRYAPRRVTLAPNQPQAIRIGIRPPAGLADGEYRAHMLFRGIPDATPVTEAPSAGSGVSVSLTPIYGVSIPIIVRQGRLEAAASLSDVMLVDVPEGKALSVTLARSGGRSIYGELRVRAPGQKEPVVAVRGIAVYAELGQRQVVLPVEPEVAARLHGPVTVEYLEQRDGQETLLASETVTLP